MNGYTIFLVIAGIIAVLVLAGLLGGPNAVMFVIEILTAFL